MPDTRRPGQRVSPLPTSSRPSNGRAVLPDAKWREVHDRFAHRRTLDDSLALARELVDEGTLTEFQARRLLKGKKSLAFGRYALLDHIGQGARGRVFKARHRLMDRVVALKVILPDSALIKDVGRPVLPRDEDRRAPRPPQRGPRHRCRRA